ncbi:MAG: 5-(carboxyamino)imidazole ribonucleotide mutase [Planctomycetota bacterium]
MTKTQPVVGVVMGSDSDLPVMQSCLDLLDELDVPHEVRVISAHRTPDVAQSYAAAAAERGVKVLIAAAGMSAALSGVLAAQTQLPVIGVPMASGPLSGVDAALSTMQMPPGVPVGCMAVGEPGAKNAAVYAAAILALGDEELAGRLSEFRSAQRRKVVEADASLRQRGG